MEWDLKPCIRLVLIRHTPYQWGPYRHVGRQREDDAAKILAQTNAMVKSCCIFINRMNLTRYKALKTLGLRLGTIL